MVQVRLSRGTGVVLCFRLSLLCSLLSIDKMVDYNPDFRYLCFLELSLSVNVMLNICR